MTSAVAITPEISPKLPIMVRVKASYNEGLSAGLFQRSTKGWQPVHFMSRRQQLQSDNGPPFNSKEFAAFAEEKGFQHHRVTPLHPRANGQVDCFMQILNKTEQIAHLQGNTGLQKHGCP